MANVREYDVEKLNKVKEEITEKNKELLSEISGALANNDRNTYDYLKTLQLQCEAQLRLIRLFESDFEDSKYTIC